MEIKRSPLLAFAKSARAFNSGYVSVFLVYNIFLSGNSSSSFLPSFSAISRQISFSKEKSPRAPLSLPPWPASIMIVLKRSFCLRLWMLEAVKTDTASNAIKKVAGSFFNHSIVIVFASGNIHIILIH